MSDCQVVNSTDRDQERIEAYAENGIHYLLGVIQSICEFSHSPHPLRKKRDYKGAIEEIEKEIDLFEQARTMEKPGHGQG